MNPIKPQVPDGSRVYSSLFRAMDPDLLTQDMLAISLPSGFYIDVGWFPEHDPAGHYVVRVFYQYWNAQQIPPIRVKTIDEVLQLVESLAVRFNSPAVSTPSTGSESRQVILPV
jgi:hypothetical protein